VGQRRRHFGQILGLSHGILPDLVGLAVNLTYLVPFTAVFIAQLLISFCDLLPLIVINGVRDLGNQVGFG
jgi:hypothetical protein